MAGLSVDQKLSLLIDQSNFLIEKQKEAQDDGRALFEGLIFFIEEKIGQESDKDKIQHLKEVGEMFVSQAQDVQDAIDDDIEYVAEQKEGLIELRDKVSDSERKKELLYSIVDEGDEISPIDEFKEEVIREAESSKAHLSAMIEDFKSALEEDKIEEVKLHLQAMFDSEEDEGDFEGVALDCGSCAGCGTGDGCGAPLQEDNASIQPKACACGKMESCGCSGSCGKKGTDIFAALDESSDHNA